MSKLNFDEWYSINEDRINFDIELAESGADREMGTELHNSDIDTDFVPVNQLAHIYLTPERMGNDEAMNMIIVDPKSFDRVNSIENERIAMAKLKKK